MAPAVKSPLANAGDTRNVGSIPGLGRSPGVGNGKPLQYSYLEKVLAAYSSWDHKESGMREHSIAFYLFGS